MEKALRDAAKLLEAAGWEVIERDCPPFRRPVEIRLACGSPSSVAPRRGREGRGGPRCQLVYEQMAALCPEPSLNGMLDILQARVTLAREWGLFLEQHPVLICPVSAELPFPDRSDVESPAGFRRVFEAS